MGPLGDSPADHMCRIVVIREERVTVVHKRSP
jgi:hypothetical protein